jgi:hypothetical protein
VSFLAGLRTYQHPDIKEKIEVSECLLSFGAESFVFQFAIQKFKD